MLGDGGPAAGEMAGVGLQSWFLPENGVHIPVLRPQHSWKGPWALLTLSEMSWIEHALHKHLRLDVGESV